MTKRPEAIAKGHAATRWIAARKLPLAIAGATIFLLALCAWAGHESTNEFTRNVLANLVADGLIALLVFLAVNWAFSGWERQRQAVDALRMARSMLLPELRANKAEIRDIVSELEGGSRPPEAILMQGPPRTEKRNWQLATEMPFASALPQDVFEALVQSYNQCEILATAEWYRTAKNVYVSSSERRREALVAEALPHFKAAVDSIDRALAMLSLAPQQN